MCRYFNGLVMQTLNISWFSAGVSSAVATKLVLDEIDEIVYTHIDDQHTDTLRFLDDCERWFNRPITRLQSPHRNVDEAIRAAGSGYVNGPAGAPCTRILKRRVRKDWETLHEGIHLVYFWGMDLNETSRCTRLEQAMPFQEHRFPLIEKEITKQKAHEILNASKIKRPKMYDLGYQNNNCIGCLKGGMGYWNKIRIDFPEIFRLRAEMERRVGGTCIKGVYLDELEPARGHKLKPICEDCGIFCELLEIT